MCNLHVRIIVLVMLKNPVWTSVPLVFDRA